MPCYTRLFPTTPFDFPTLLACTGRDSTSSYRVPGFTQRTAFEFLGPYLREDPLKLYNREFEEVMQLTKLVPATPAVEGVAERLEQQAREEIPAVVDAAGAVMQPARSALPYLPYIAPVTLRAAQPAREQLLADPLALFFEMLRTEYRFQSPDQVRELMQFTRRPEESVAQMRSRMENLLEALPNLLTETKLLRSICRNSHTMKRDAFSSSLSLDTRTRNSPSDRQPGKLSHRISTMPTWIAEILQQERAALSRLHPFTILHLHLQGTPRGRHPDINPFASTDSPWQLHNQHGPQVDHECSRVPTQHRFHSAGTATAAVILTTWQMHVRIRIYNAAIASPTDSRGVAT